MPIQADYLRRQAETCLRLARATADPVVAAELVRMAEDFYARAAEVEGEQLGGCGGA
jgi:hypothetical protein